MPETLLSTYEAGRELGVCDSRIRQMVKAGLLRLAFVTLGGQYLLAPADVDALKRQRAAARTAKAATAQANARRAA